MFLLPLPCATLWGMGYFNAHYASKLQECSRVCSLPITVLTNCFSLRIEPSTRLSLERAREYDRVSEWLAKNKVPGTAANVDTILEDAEPQPSSSDVEYGIEGRRHQFDKNSYRQPVLTQRPLKPKNYRRGQPDAEADRVRTRLRELQDYDLMEESEAGPGASAASGLDAPALA